ncbi:MAG: hypothetical protein U9R00_01235 [Patescibacteria group bacterium]|nr:hypothetical protein [Patescibacteria group bacterium]
MTRKKPIQKAIFKNLTGKKAVSSKYLKKGIKKMVNKSEYAINRSLKNMAKKGLIECLESDNDKYFRLSQKGREGLNRATLDDKTALITKNWDGYWRFIILDLPEERKNEREALRYLLKKAGFICLKNSVWVSMYPFEHLFNNIKKDLNLTTELIILVTRKIDTKTEDKLMSLYGIN